MKYPIMRRLLCILFLTLLAVSCGQAPESPTARQIVDRAIAAAGGERFGQQRISFDFREHHYIYQPHSEGRILKRIRENGETAITDVLQDGNLQRKINDSLVVVPDSMARKYANSVNSVHYFAYLPMGLNDPAVNKELLGETEIGGTPYYEVRVTFDRQGGGVDFEDVYVYWFNKETYKPDYLAYRFQSDGGGQRFRKAYNERYVGGIRFVDYENYEYGMQQPIESLDSLYQAGRLTRLSTIDLRNVRVSPDNYN